MKIGDIVQLNDFRTDLEPQVDGLRVAMLGAGKMADLHLATLKHIKGVDLVGICNRSSDSGEKLAQKFGINAVYKNPLQMFRETAPDALVLAVSHHATVEATSLALEMKIPCLIEKPAGYSSDETKKLAALASANDCYNMIALNRRFYSVVNQALLAVQHYGPIKGILIEAHEPVQRFRNRQQFDGWLFDKWLIANTIHLIDLFRMIGGEISAIQSFKQAESERNGDSFAANIQFENGILGTFVSHWNSNGGSVLKIYGCGVTAELSPLESGFVRYHDGRTVKLKPSAADKTFKPGLFEQMTTFLRDVEERNIPSFPASDLSDNVKTMELVESLQR